MKINPVPNVFLQIKLHCMIMFTFELRDSYNMQNRNVTKPSLQLKIIRIMFSNMQYCYYLFTGLYDVIIQCEFDALTLF